MEDGRGVGGGGRLMVTAVDSVSIREETGQGDTLSWTMCSSRQRHALVETGPERVLGVLGTTKHT